MARVPAVARRLLSPGLPPDRACTMSTARSPIRPAILIAPLLLGTRIRAGA